jgi:hypothetical protein
VDERELSIGQEKGNGTADARADTNTLCRILRCLQVAWKRRSVDVGTKKQRAEDETEKQEPGGLPEENEDPERL